MAKPQNPIIGRTKGQAGGMVFSTVFGQNVMRSRPASYRDANTASQQSNRSFMRLIAKALSTIKILLPSLFIKPPVGMAPYSKVVSQVRNAIKSLPENVTTGIHSIRLGSFSRTDLVTDTDTIAITGGGTISVEAADNDYLKSIDYTLELVLVNLTKGQSFVFTADSVAGNATIEVDPIWTSNNNDLVFVHKAVKFKAGADLSKSVK